MNSADIVIILTCTVNVQPHKSWVFQKDRDSRIRTYTRSISQWLQKTNFNIVVVDNSGYDFSDGHDFVMNGGGESRPRLDIVCFNECDVEEAGYLKTNDSKGASEMFAIDYAYNHSAVARAAKFVIKITGRYFIEELEDFMNQLPDLDAYDCLTQFKRSRCEMVGSHAKNFTDVFALQLLNQCGRYDGHVEHIWRFRTSQYSDQRVLVCKEFAIEPTVRGGINETFYSI